MGRKHKHLPPGVGWVKKWGENYRCNFHDTFIQEVSLRDTYGHVHLACPMCILEEMGEDGIGVAEKIPENELQQNVGSEEVIPKLDAICQYDTCMNDGLGECKRCKKRFCGQHIFVPRNWCAECSAIGEIDLDDEEGEPDDEDAKELAMRIFGHYAGVVN